MRNVPRGTPIALLLILSVWTAYCLPPDLDRSDRVDGKDLIRFSRAWGATPRDRSWDARADLDFSELIDDHDRMILAKYFGMVGRVRRIWILDQSAEALKRLADDGTLLAGFNGFSNPQTVAANPQDGSLWLADYGNQRVVHLDKDGAVLARVTGFANPQGVAVNQTNGACWVADTDHDRVVLLSPDTPDGYDVATSSGHHTIAPGFNNPQAVAVNQTDGSCWVADSYHGQVVKLSAKGAGELARRGGFSQPRALAVNAADGSCWVADTYNNRIVKLAFTGTELLRLDKFNAPEGICVNPNDGSCLVTDTGAGEVVKLDRDGAVVFRVGGFSSPLGPFADPATGCFWIADSYHHQVVKLSANGTELLRISGFSYPRSGVLDQGESGKYRPPTALAFASPQQGADPLPVSFACLASDPDGSILRYQWDFEGDGLFDYSSVTTASVAHDYTRPGIYNPILRVVDDQGLTALDSSIIIRVGRLTATASANPSSGYAPLTVNFTGTYFDPVDGRVENFQWDFDGDGVFEYFSETNPNTSYRYATRGVRRAIFKVTDSGGLTAQDAVMIQVLPIGPEIHASADPLSGGAPLTVHFTGSGDDPDGFVVLYQWDFDGDTFFDWHSTANGNTTHVYTQRQTVTPIFMVTDNSGLSTITSLKITVANTPPVAEAEAHPAEGNAPLTVNLHGSGRDPDGSIVLYEWAFEGGRFFDDMESGPGNWTADQPWALITTDSHSPVTCWTDSPQGNYADNVDVSLMSTPVDLSVASDKKLTFWHRYDLAWDWWWSIDYGRVEISTDGGNSWTGLASYYGSQSWTKEEIDLTAFGAATNARIRFRLTSDSSYNADGWYIDDVEVGWRAGNFSWSSPTTGTVTHRFETPGVYYPTLRVTDNEGSQGLASVRVVVKPSGTPIAHADATPRSGPVPLTVNFNGTGEDASGTIVLYRWDFGETYQTNASGYPTTQLFLGFWPATGWDDVSSSRPAVMPTNPSEGETFEDKTWGKYSDDDGIFLWSDVFGYYENVYAYSLIYVNSPTTQTVRIKYGVDDSVRFWINEALVERNAYGGGLSVDQFSFDTQLRGGWNKILVAVTNGWWYWYYDWGLAYRFTDTSDNPLRLTYSVNEPYTRSLTYESSSTGHTQHTYVCPAVYTATLTVVDNDGLSDQDSVEITVLARPRALIQNPRSGNEYLRNAVVFVGEGTDMDGTVVLYEWDFDGNGTYDYSSRISGSVFWVYAQTGDYTAVFRVTDNDNLQTTASVTFRIVAQGPTVTAEANPKEGIVPLSVAFNGQASDKDGTIVQFAWDFEGDGTYDWFNEGEPGAVVRYPGQYNNTTCAAKNLLDGKDGSEHSWVSAIYPTLPVELVFDLKGDAAWNIDRVILNSNTDWWYIIKDFEIEVSTTSPDSGFSHWMTAEAAYTDQDQIFTSSAIAAKYVKLRILSTWDWPYYVTLAEFEVYEGNRNVLSLTPRVTHTYSSLGRYLATLRVTDNDALTATDTVTIITKPVGAPTAQIEEISPDPGYVSQEVRFRGSGTDTDGQIVSYEWDFEGDGTYDSFEDGILRSQSVTGRDIPPSLQPPGSFRASTTESSFTVRAAGTDIWGTSDEFYFVYTYVQGDFDLRVNVEITSVPHLWTKAGLMIRADLTSGSPHAMIIMRQDGMLVAQERPSAGGLSRRLGDYSSEETQFAQVGPARLRLSRSGWYVVVGYDDLDGNEQLEWLWAYCPNLPPDSPVAVGFVLTSHTSDTLAEARFTSASLSPLQGVATHIYNTIGTYHPTFRVTDNDGLTDTDARVLRIEPGILRDGAVWVADTYHSQIVKLLLDGTERLRLSGYSYPRAVAANQSTHEVWIADTNNDQVVKISADGQELLRLSGFDDPWSVAVNPVDGSCWVADGNHGAVVKMGASGAQLATVYGFSYPLDVSVNPSDGACWVADQYAGCVVKLRTDVPDGYDINTSSTHHTTAGGFYYPVSVAVNSSDGTCYVADMYHYQVVRLSADCRTELWRVGGFGRPCDAAVNPVDGSCWVADDWGDQIVKLSSGGSELVRRGGFIYPCAVSVNPFDGTCWVTDYYQSVAVKLSPFGCEMARTSGFYYPWGIDVDPPAQTTGPVAVATASPLSGPVPLTVLLSGTCTTATSAAIVRYEWDFEGDGTFDYASPTTATVTHVYSIAGKYGPVFRVTDTQQRLGHDYHLIIRVGQLTAFASANQTEGNAPLQVQFSHSGVDPVARITQYDWDFDGDGRFDYSSASPGYTYWTYYRGGIYTAFLRVTNDQDAMAYDYVTVTVRQTAPVAVAYADPNSGSSPLSVMLSGSSSYDRDGSIVFYQWDYDGDGTYDWSSTTEGDAGCVYSRSGTYRPTLRVTDNDGLASTASLTVTVTNAQPSVQAVAEPMEGNAPLTVNLSGICSDPDGKIVLYEWDFNGDAVYDFSSPTTATVSHEYPAAGNYRARLRVTDNESASATDDVDICVKVAGSPTARADASPRTGKAPLLVNFDGTASDPDGTVTLYRWDFGETYQTNASGYPTTQLFLGFWPAIGWDDVSSSRPAVMPTNPSEGETFEDKTWRKCSDDDGIFWWYDVFGYQSNVYAYSLIYVNSPTTQTVRIKYGVDDSVRFWINETLVEQNAYGGGLSVDQFSFDTQLRGGWNKILVAVTSDWWYWYYYGGLAYRFTDTSDHPLRLMYSVNEPYTRPLTYESSSTGHTQHTYHGAGTYTATLTVVDNDGKSDTDTVTITVSQGYPPRPIPRAYPSQGTAPLTVRFPANGEDLDGTIDYFQWDFTSDGTWDWTSYRPEQASYTYLAPGTYRATLQAVDDDGLSGQDSVTIYVYPPSGLSVTARATPDDGEAPLTVSFSGWATGTNGFLRLFEWDFNGDGLFDWSSATDASTSYTYTVAEFYRAVLRITDSVGQTGMGSVPVDVKLAGSPHATVVATPTHGDATLDVLFEGSATDSDGHIVSLEWDFNGDGVYDRFTSMSGITTDTVYYSYPISGRYEVALRATDNSGLTDLAHVTITVNSSFRAYRGAESFDPTQNQTVEIITVPTEPTSLTMRLLASDGRVVRTLLNNVSRDAGYHTDAWDGRDDAGQIVPAGAYFFVADYTVNGQVFHYDLTNTANPNGYAPSVTYPLTFDPIEDRPFYAQYTANNAFEATVYVLVSDPPPWGWPKYALKTIVMREPRKSGPYVDVWDGTDDQGNLVPPGFYAMGVWVWDLPDNAIIVASRPIISDVSKEPDYFDPATNPYGSQQQLEIRYRLSKPARVTLTIEDAGSNVYKTIQQNQSGAGVFSAFWDGKNQNGDLLYPGTYKIGFEAVDDLGNRSIKTYCQFKIFY